MDVMRLVRSAGSLCRMVGKVANLLECLQLVTSPDFWLRVALLWLAHYEEFFLDT